MFPNRLWVSVCNFLIPNRPSVTPILHSFTILHSFWCLKMSSRYALCLEMVSISFSQESTFTNTKVSSIGNTLMSRYHSQLKHFFISLPNSWKYPHIPLSTSLSSNPKNKGQFEKTSDMQKYMKPSFQSFVLTEHNRMNIKPALLFLYCQMQQIQHMLMKRKLKFFWFSYMTSYFLHWPSFQLQSNAFLHEKLKMLLLLIIFHGQ